VPSGRCWAYAKPPWRDKLAARVRRARRPGLASLVLYHRRDSIEAHLTIVLAARAVSRWTEARTGWSIRKFVRTARRYRTIESQAGIHVITAADPCPATFTKLSAACTTIPLRAD